MDYTDGSGYCPSCKLHTAFERTAHLTVSPTVHDHDAPGRFARKPDFDSTWVDVSVYECQYCAKTVTLREHWALLPNDDAPVAEADEDGNPTRSRLPTMLDREMIFPHRAPRTLHETVPDGIRSLYAEASKCEHAGAMRAAGVMYRAAVEELVKERGATGRDLYTKIEALKSSGLDDDLVDDLHEARLLGNDSIHAGIAYSAEEVADVAGLIEDASITLYVQPAERSALRDSRQARRDAARSRTNGSVTPA